MAALCTMPILARALPHWPHGESRFRHFEDPNCSFFAPSGEAPNGAAYGCGQVEEVVTSLFKNASGTHTVSYIFIDELCFCWVPLFEGREVKTLDSQGAHSTEWCRSGSMCRGFSLARSAPHFGVEGCLKITYTNKTKN